MTERLVRALRAGGAVCRLSDGRYGVWRGRDKRGRIIGYLSPAQVQHWRLSDKLQRYGDGVPEAWVWRAVEDLEVTRMAPSPQALCILDHLGTQTAYLARLILFRSGPARERLILQIQAFRGDYAHIHAAVGLSSMDWEGLSYGVRIDRSPQILKGERGGRRCAARFRLQALRNLLGDADWQTWLRISVHLWSLRDFERRAKLNAATLSHALPRLIGALDAIYAEVAADR